MAGSILSLASTGLYMYEKYRNRNWRFCARRHRRISFSEADHEWDESALFHPSFNPFVFPWENRNLALQRPRAYLTVTQRRARMNSWAAASGLSGDTNLRLSTRWTWDEQSAC